MEPVEKIDDRIDELKWKALPFFDRVVYQKSHLQGKKYYTKKRLKELRWFNFSCNISLGLFVIFNIYIAFNPKVSVEMQWFLLLVLTVFIALKVELKKRYSYLREVIFLKHLKKEIPQNS